MRNLGWLGSSWWRSWWCGPGPAVVGWSPPTCAWAVAVLLEPVGLGLSWGWFITVDSIIHTFAPALYLISQITATDSSSDLALPTTFMCSSSTMYSTQLYSPHFVVLSLAVCRQRNCVIIQKCIILHDLLPSGHSLLVCSTQRSCDQLQKFHFHWLAEIWGHGLCARWLILSKSFVDSGADSWTV